MVHVQELATENAIVSRVALLHDTEDQVRKCSNDPVTSRALLFSQQCESNRREALLARLNRVGHGS